MKRLLALILAYFFLIVAVIGIFLSLLPTVPFLLLSAWLASIGSEKLHHWLYTHPYLGKQLKQWDEQGAISRNSKITAITMLIVSWTIIFCVNSNMWVVYGLAILFIVVSLFIVSRPLPNE